MLRPVRFVRSMHEEAARVLFVANGTRVEDVEERLRSAFHTAARLRLSVNGETLRGDWTTHAQDVEVETMPCPALLAELPRINATRMGDVLLPNPLRLSERILGAIRGSVHRVRAVVVVGVGDEHVNVLLRRTDEILSSRWEDVLLDVASRRTLVEFDAKTQIPVLVACTSPRRQSWLFLSSL